MHQSIILLLLGVAAVSANSMSRVLEQEYEIYKQTHGKVYRNPYQNDIRMETYFDNRYAILEHNFRFQEGKESYKKGINQFTDMTQEESAAYRQCLNSEPINESSPMFMPPADEVALPNFVNWRTKGAVTAVKNQGPCGSCWAFSATGGLEAQHYLKTGKLVSLSEQNLMDCDKLDHACNGGNMINAWTFIKKEGGIDTEQSYPYAGVQGNCRYNSSDAAVGVEDKGYIAIDPTEDDLKKAVATVGPISVGMLATHALQVYSEGIFIDPDCVKGGLNHGVLVVGYGSEDGKDYWIVKNSWGTGWGENGYFRMIRNKGAACQIQTMAMYPLV